MREAARGVREYSGSAPSMQMLKLIDVLLDVYLLELVSVTPEALTGLQAVIRQLEALRGVLAGEPLAHPRI